MKGLSGQIKTLSPPKHLFLSLFYNLVFTAKYNKHLKLYIHE